MVTNSRLPADSFPSKIILLASAQKPYSNSSHFLRASPITGVTGCHCWVKILVPSPGTLRRHQKHSGPSGQQAGFWLKSHEEIVHVPTAQPSHCDLDRRRIVVKNILDACFSCMYVISGLYVICMYIYIYCFMHNRHCGVSTVYIYGFVQEMGCVANRNGDITCQK